jgi:hypothetical protein
MRNFSILLLVVLFGFIGCKKSDRDEDTSVNSSEDYATGQTIAHDIFKMVNQIAFSVKGITTNNLADTTTLFGCDTLIIDTVNSPKTISIQFNGSCSYSGINRKGTVIISFSNNYDTPGAITTISFNNYCYNSYTITSGTITIVNNGIVNSNPSYSFSANNLSVENNKQQLLIWTCSQSFTVTTGETTATFTDDTYVISGSANGTAYRGNNFSANITSNLTLNGNCNWIDNGNVDIRPTNKSIRNLDFGAGCDNNASVTVYDIAYEITF